MYELHITLKSDLCAGNGESTGLGVDTDLCTDAYGLPYIPARRLKGCLREAAGFLLRAGCSEAQDETRINALFGDRYGHEGSFRIGNAVLCGAASMQAWLSDKSGVPACLQQQISPQQITRLYTTIRGQTRLTDGVAERNTLRFTRVLRHFDPLSGGELRFVCPVTPSEDPALLELLKACCRATRHIGTHRNRGLGNVSMELLPSEKSGSEDHSQDQRPSIPDAERVRIAYTLLLQDPVTILDGGELKTEIPARSIIGCMSRAWLRDGSAESETFRQLFLDGSVCWSAATPRAAGRRSVPAPLMLVYMKNEKQYRNLMTATADELRGKRKTLEGYYAAERQYGFSLTRSGTQTVYHHSHGDTRGQEDGGVKGTLYMQEALTPGMLFAGEVTAPRALAETVLRLLEKAEFAFGRSRSAQYAGCRLYKTPEVTPADEQKRQVENGEVVYAVVQSDLLLMENGIFDVSVPAVRRAIAKAAGLENVLPPDKRDVCAYHTVGGYQQRWQLQKQQVETVCGGSVYCFPASGNALPREITVGENRQEGFGRIRLYTAEELTALSKIDYVSPEREVPQPDGVDRSPLLKRELLIATAGERMRSRAVTLGATESREVETGKIGRLRLMLGEAESYADFYKRMDSMKESDVSAEKTISAKEKAISFVQKLCGNDGTRFSVRCALDDDALFREIEKDPEAMRCLSGAWKAPLRMMLHEAYYRREELT